MTPITVATEPPMGLMANLDYRSELALAMDRDKAVREEVMRRCRGDLCYFVNALGWTYQAKPFPQVLPMVLYPLQTRYMKLLQADGGRRHFHIDKSRDMGLTWCTLFWVFWCWLLMDGVKFHLASWKEWLVDQRGHPGTHFAKLDHMLAKLPECIKPIVRTGRERRKMFLIHPDHGAVITGESTSRRMGHQDRNFAAILDEFALMGETPKDGYAILGGIRPTTDCMILQSTPQGVGNAFADYKTKAHNQSSFWWPDHPVKGRGLSGPGINECPASGFWSDDVERLRGRLTSPWFEQQKAEAVNLKEIAQEIEIDYTGSGWQFFPETALRKILITDVMPPLHEGELVFEPNSGMCKGFSRGRGPLKLWINPNRSGWPSTEFDYFVGADIAAGTQDASGAGLSNSCAVVMNKQAGEVVAELTVHGVDPADFAVMVVALCYYFHKAQLIWEGNGPGQHFTRVVVEKLRYQNIYYRKPAQISRNQKNQVLTPGFWTLPTNKTWMLGAYRYALVNRHVIEHCKEAILECRMYQEEASGGAVHAVAASTPDPTGARENHADRVVARVLAYRFMCEDGYDPLSYQPAQQRIIPASCLAAVREPDRRQFAELGY